MNSGLSDFPEQDGVTFEDYCIDFSLNTTPVLLFSISRDDLNLLETKALDAVLAERKAGLIRNLIGALTPNPTLRTLRVHYLLGRQFVKNGEPDYQEGLKCLGVAQNIYEYLIANSDTDAERIAEYGEKVFGLVQNGSGLLVNPSTYIPQVGPTSCYVSSPETLN